MEAQCTAGRGAVAAGHLQGSLWALNPWAGNQCFHPGTGARPLRSVGRQSGSLQALISVHVVPRAPPAPVFVTLMSPSTQWRSSWALCHTPGLQSPTGPQASDTPQSPSSHLQNADSKLQESKRDSCTQNAQCGQPTARARPHRASALAGGCHLGFPSSRWIAVDFTPQVCLSVLLSLLPFLPLLLPFFHRRLTSRLQTVLTRASVCTCVYSRASSQRPRVALFLAPRPPCASPGCRGRGLHASQTSAVAPAGYWHTLHSRGPCFALGFCRSNWSWPASYQFCSQIVSSESFPLRPVLTLADTVSADLGVVQGFPVLRGDVDSGGVVDRAGVGTGNSTASGAHPKPHHEPAPPLSASGSLLSSGYAGRGA